MTSAPNTPTVITSPKEPPNQGQSKPVPGAWHAYWPPVTDLASARSAVKQGVFAAFFCAVVTAAFALWAHFGGAEAQTLGLNIFALADAFLFALVGVGLCFNSRVAAVFGLVLYVGERVLAWRSLASVNFFLVIVLVLAFVNAIRGSFASFRLKAAERFAPNAPIEP